jgi:hypothetical protein
MATVHQQRKIGASTYGTEFKYFLQLLYSVSVFGLFNAVVDSEGYRPSTDWRKQETGPVHVERKIRYNYLNRSFIAV